MSTQQVACNKIYVLDAPKKGRAPQWVRAAWVRLVLPCFPLLEDAPDGDERGEPCCGYVVPFAPAIDILRAHEPLAAAWWDRYGDPEANLVFLMDEVVGIKRVFPPATMSDYDW